MKIENLEFTHNTLLLVKTTEDARLNYKQQIVKIKNK